jgi:hypothetical protein
MSASRKQKGAHTQLERVPHDFLTCETTTLKTDVVCAHLGPSLGHLHLVQVVGHDRSVSHSAKREGVGCGRGA